MSEDLINAENAYTDVKKRNEKLKLIINEHKTVCIKNSFDFRWKVLCFIQCLEYRNIKTVFRRICSVYRRTETEICGTQTTRTRKIK